MAASLRGQNAKSIDHQKKQMMVIAYELTIQLSMSSVVLIVTVLIDFALWLQPPRHILSVHKAV